MAKAPKEILFPPHIIAINKPVGLTSASYLNKLKWRLPIGVGKIGHFGTLDPFASGLLLIGLAGATRLSNFIQRDCPKTYIATGILGLSSPTGDLTASDEMIISKKVNDSIVHMSKVELDKKAL